MEKRENCQVWGFKHRLAQLSQGFPKWSPPMAGKLKPGWFWGVDPTALARRAQKGELRGLRGKEGDQDHHRGFLWTQELVCLAREMKDYASF